jgi:hypothetical protein
MAILCWAAKNSPRGTSTDFTTEGTISVQKERKSAKRTGFKPSFKTRSFKENQFRLDTSFNPAASQYVTHCAVYTYCNIFRFKCPDNIWHCV